MRSCCAAAQPGAPRYLEGLQEGERQCPTGLGFGDFAGAPPHVTFEPVLPPALVVALLSEALPFQAMDDPTRQHLRRLAFRQTATWALQQPGFFERLIALQTPLEISACLTACKACCSYRPPRTRVSEKPALSLFCQLK